MDGLKREAGADARAQGIGWRQAGSGLQQASKQASSAEEEKGCARAVDCRAGSVRDLVEVQRRETFQIINQIKADCMT